MAKYLLKNNDGETLGEYARKDAALKAAKAADLPDGDFKIENDKGEVVHPAPKGKSKPAKVKTPRVKAKALNEKVGDFTVKSEGSLVVVLDAEGKRAFLCPKSSVNDALTLPRGRELRKYNEILIDGSPKAWIAKGINKTQEKALVSAAKTAIANAAKAAKAAPAAEGDLI